MQSYKIWNFILVVLMAVFLWRCASQQALTGGPKDEIAPELQSSFPEDQSINYTATSFELVFDEYVKADKLLKELIITPITEVKYQVKVKKNIVVLEFDSLLEANTTYTFNFRNGIEDITERNPAENLRLAFSTGPVIDSLSLEGTVTDLMLGTPVKDASVILYKAADTLTVNGGKPMYMVQTDASGNFSITNLKVSEYQLLVLEEKDGNLTYSKAEERIGFLGQNIQLDSNMTAIELPLISYDILDFQLQRVRSNKQYIDFTFNKQVGDFNIKATDTKYQDYLFPVPNKEVLRLFPPVNVLRDSFEISIHAADTLGNAIDSTLIIGFRETKRLEEMAFEVKATPAGGTKMLDKDTSQLQLQFNKPVATFQADSAWVYTAEDTLPFTAVPQKTKVDTQWEYELLGMKLPYRVVFKRGSFVSIEQDTLKEFSLAYSPKVAEDYGTVTGTIETWKTSFTIQLLNNGKVAQEIQNERNFQFNWIEPGSKTLRILIDDNEDGTWSKGDFSKRILPETIYFYPAEITVKANWEVALDPISF